MPTNNDMTMWKEVKRLQEETPYLYVRMKWFPLNSFVHIVNTKTTRQKKMRTLCGYYVDFDTDKNAEMRVEQVSVNCPEGHKPCRPCEEMITALFKERFLNANR